MEYSKINNPCVYPAHFEDKIGFTFVKEQILNECLSPLGAYYVNKFAFLVKHALIEKHIKQTVEFISICESYNDFPCDNYFDIRDDLKKLTLEGIFINVETLHKLLLSLQTFVGILKFFNDKEEKDFYTLKKLTSNYTIDNYILKWASDIIDEEGIIKDSASEKLMALRKAKKMLLKKREKKIDTIYMQWLNSGIASDTGITIRNARLVIPVIASHKRQVKGFIYDESGSGQIVYMEPAELFEINNEITDLEYAEKKEIIRLLTAFTDYIRPELKELINCYELLGLIDFIRAKARYSIKIEAISPHIESTPCIDWKKARHPLLLHKSKNTPHKVIPLDITLNPSQQILIISGPNSGGKSVCLKTTGLLQYMFQCGLPIPVSEGSVCGIFNTIFIEIGDEQSLENDLSTYSSHLKNLAYFIKHASNTSLFLIDEMGSGTEPQMGAAIAESILENLYHKNALGIVTTHYTNLKMLAQKHKNIQNGAMLFDIKNLMPLYELKIGEQGSSFAFEIAQKIGLDKTVIEQAKQKIDVNVLGIEEYFIKVKEKDRLIQNKMKEIEKSDEILSTTYEKYMLLLNKLENEKHNILNKAKEDAQVLLNEANKKIEYVIKSIKENEAEKEITKSLRLELKQEQEKLIPTNSTPTPKEEKPEKKIQHKKEPLISKEKTLKTAQVGTPLQKGDYVIITGQNEVGFIEEIKDSVVHVVFGSLRIKTRIEKLLKVINYVPEKPKKSIGMGIINSISEKQKHFNTKLDLRGQRTEEALKMLDDYIHDAVLCGINPVKILHGKGEGILRPMIREWLSRNAFVKKYYDERVELGGQGITIVEIL